jgi:Transposase IS116/IS110/IS902 family
VTELPGAGQFTALVMLAEIGDITRFGSARKLASWAGLTPTVRGSDLTVRHGHIFEQGPAWLRWVLNQAAQTAKCSPEFSATYAAIAKRPGKKIATIAITRMGSHPATRAYVERRTAEGKSKKEIIRCLKRYVAREVYPHLRASAG